MATVTINGVSYNGSSVAIRGSQVIIDGKVQEQGVKGTVELVVVKGQIESLECSGNVTVEGNVDGNISAAGNVNCGNVAGNVSAAGNVNCASVGRSVASAGQTGIGWNMVKKG